MAGLRLPHHDAGPGDLPGPERRPRGRDSTRHDPGIVYGIPFGGCEPRRLVAGFGSPTHLAENFYALDFAMPEGTPVLAARGGVVVVVQDGFIMGGLREDLIEKANLVAIAHGDGTLASYGHLRSGVAVAVGDSVSRGQLLGPSGSSGFSGIPHLHFHVGKQLTRGMDRTIPFRLGDSAGNVLEPLEGAWYLPAQPAGRDAPMCARWPSTEGAQLSVAAPPAATSPCGPA